MGITTEQCLLYETCNSKTATCAVRKPDEGCPVYRYFKKLIIQNYNERLNADKVAMLTEIQMEIEKKSYYDTTIIGDYEDEVRIDLVELDDVNEVIQQKINGLEAESEHQESEG